MIDLKRDYSDTSGYGLFYWYVGYCVEEPELTD